MKNSGMQLRVDRLMGQGRRAVTAVAAVLAVLTLCACRQQLTGKSVAGDAGARSVGAVGATSGETVPALSAGDAGGDCVMMDAEGRRFLASHAAVPTQLSGWYVCGARIAAGGSRFVRFDFT